MDQFIDNDSKSDGIIAKVRDKQGIFVLGGTAIAALFALAIFLLSAAKPVSSETAPPSEAYLNRAAPYDLSANFIDKPIKESGVFVFDSEDTFTGSLKYLGSSSDSIKKIVGGLDDTCELNRVSAGSEMKFELIEGRGIVALSFPCAATKIAHVKVNGDALNTKIEEIPHFTREKVYACEVVKGHSLIWSCAKYGITEGQVMEIAKAFRSDIDFNNDVQAGDMFKVLVNEVQDSEGKRLIAGEVLAAHVILQSKEHWAIKYKGPEGKGYFDSRGMSRVKTFLRSPLPFLSVSSGFTLKRFHPILGKNRPHLGVDFAAPTGTSVMASASGRVVEAGYQGGYGNMIKVRHGQLTTLYAHLSRIKVRKDQYVRQGQVIGAVGSTGMSTGPHLHYGMYKNGIAINPMSVKMDTSMVIGSPTFKALRDHAVEMLKNAKPVKLQ